MRAAGLGVQRGIQRKCATTVVLKPVTLGSSPARAAEQDRAGPAPESQSFHPHRTRRRLRRIQVQAKNIGRLAFELRIVTGHVTLQTMGSETGFFPDSMHRVFADPECRCQFATTPMRGTVAGLLAGGRENPGVQRGSQHRGRLAG